MKSIIRLRHLYYLSVIASLYILYSDQLFGGSMVWLVATAISFLIGLVGQCQNGLFIQNFSFKRLAKSLFAAYAIGLCILLISLCLSFAVPQIEHLLWGEHLRKVMFLFSLLPLPLVWKYLKV